MNTAFTRSALIASGICAAILLLAVAVLDLLGAQDEVDGDHRRQAHTVAGAVLISTGEDDLRRVLARTPAGVHGRVAVHLPDGRLVGSSRAAAADVASVVRHRRPHDVETGDGVLRLIPVVLNDTGTAVVEVAVPAVWFSPGFGTRFAVLLLVAAAAVATAALVARARSRPVARSVAALAVAADTLAPGRRTIDLPHTAVAELSRLRDALVDVADRWGELRTDEGKLIADLSHRLRTPLTALRLDGEGLGPGAVGDRIRQSIAALEATLDEVISSSDTTAGPVAATCDLGSVITARMDFWSTMAETQHRATHLDLTDQPTHVALSESVARSVLDTLLVNVFQYTPPGTPFAVTLVEHAHWVTLVVDDGGTGIGNPDAALRRGSSGAASTGLGLDIARSAVESCGGSIHIERGFLGGARVRLRFPESGHDQGDRKPRAWRLWRVGQRDSNVSIKEDGSAA